MKGIKECLNWMLDNSGDKISNGEEKTYWNGHEFYSISCGETNEIINFVRFRGDWEEVIEPVDFLTAYNDCLENRIIYTRNDTRENHCDMENLNGEVIIINSASKSTNLSEFKWKKISDKQ